MNKSDGSKSKPAVLITGASSGIGAVYADRFAKRGRDLVLVARDQQRLSALAERLRREAGVSVDVLPADLTRLAELASVEARLASDERIGILINNAGAAASGTFAEQTPDAVGRLIELNTTALARLASAVTPRFLKEERGAIVNIASVVALAPEFGMTVYGATKAFALFLSQGLQLELGPRGVYVQAVLPGATRTEIWQRSGRDVNALPAVMDVEEMVDAALVGFDRREAITITHLPDAAQWQALESARTSMLSQFAQTHAPERYRSGSL